MEKEGYLGIDCGSVSIKLALIDKERNVVDSVYLKNSGIIETLSKGLEVLSRNNYSIRGVGTTGSGRTFAGALVGADLVKTEVLAHTVATLNFYSDVRTIMDIGGEDCKIMSIKNGVLENFIMNSVCGAGTGSVVDSIANRLGIPIEEVGDLALKSNKRLEFPGKCGVFAQSAVVSRLNAGFPKEDILMGVTRALVSNYLMLGKGISLEPPYVYQGATAKNKAIVSSLEEQLGSKVIVPKYAPEMGAIGIAIMVQRAVNGTTNFKGYNLDQRELKTRNTISEGCENSCELTYLYEQNKLTGCIGNRCDKCLPKTLR